MDPPIRDFVGGQTARSQSHIGGGGYSEGFYSGEVLISIFKNFGPFEGNVTLKTMMEILKNS